MAAARLALAAALLLGLLLAHLATRTPAPRSAEAPATTFSAGRAMDDVRAIARRPHPTGSAENRRVRDYLTARLRSLGLQASIQSVPAAAFTSDSQRRDGAGLGAAVENVIGVLPGRDRTAPALLIMSHYDSVPDSPGAADDAAGVAAALEAVRALRATPRPPARDIVLLFTDGEEVRLNGARAFFGEDGAAHPLARRAGAVLNLEARGGGGRVLMFETSPANGGWIDLLRRTVPRPSSTSLAVLVYERMPNGTDFTVAKAAGVPGLNFAFIGRPGQYHSPGSTPETLDRGALQHMGDQVLAVSRALAAADQLPRAAPDAVYSDVLGVTLLAYPAPAGWLILSAAYLFTAVAWFRPPPARDVMRGVLGAVLLLIGTGVALFLVSLGTARVPYYDLLAAFPRLELLLAGVCMASVLAAFAWLARRGAGAASGIWAGLVLVGLLLATALQALAPAAAPVAAWPVLLAAVAAAVRARAPGRWAAPVVAVALSALALGQVGAWWHFFALGIGYFRPEPLAMLALLASIPLAPLLLQAFAAGAPRAPAGTPPLPAGSARAHPT